MEAGLFVHKRGLNQKQQEPVADSKSEQSKSMVDRIRTKRKGDKLHRDELEEFAKMQAACVRCGCKELEILMLMRGGCSHLLCTDCFTGIKTRKLLLPNGLILAVCPVCKTDIPPDAVGERPMYLIDFVERQSSKVAHAQNDSVDYKSIVVADIHLVSRVYWTRMRVLLCRQSEVLAASYSQLQESEVAVQKSLGDIESSERNCDQALLLLEDAKKEYEDAFKSFESLEADVSGLPEITINEARPLNIERFQSANKKFLALKKLQIATKRHATLELALKECQDNQTKNSHLHNAAKSSFVHCTKNMDASYKTAFRQFDMIKMQLRETRSLLPDATGVTISESDMDEQFTLHTTIIRDLDDAKWHFQQNLVYPVDIPINIESTLKALEQELLDDFQGPDQSSSVGRGGAAEEQIASLSAAMKFEGFISPQNWELFPTKIVPNDCPTIQEAVKSLWRSCGRVIVKAGNFKEYVLLEGLVKICCEDGISAVCINPLSESQNTAIEVIGGFCMLSNLTIQSSSTKSDAPLVFCRSGHIQLESCVLRSELAIISHAIGAKSGCHFDNCRFFGGQECSGMVGLNSQMTLCAADFGGRSDFLKEAIVR